MAKFTDPRSVGAGLKEQGNALVARREFAAAAVKYSAALRGERPGDSKPTMGEEMPLLLNRALCYLRLAADREGQPDKFARKGFYEKAQADAARAVPFTVGAQQVKARFRLAQALLGRAALMHRVTLRSMGAGAEKAAAAEYLAAEVRAAQKHLGAAAEVAAAAGAAGVGGAGIAKVAAEAAALAERLRGCGAKAWSLPAPTPELFAPGVRFVPGGSAGDDAGPSPAWMDNAVHLELPFARGGGGDGGGDGGGGDSGGGGGGGGGGGDGDDDGARAPPCRADDAEELVRLPCSLLKSANENNLGELSVQLLQSDHLGEDVLRSRVGALGLSGDFDARSGSRWAMLSDPAREPGELRAPEEFVMSLGLLRRSRPAHDALVAAGVVEHVRDLGTTQHGEQRAVYRVKF
jgi:uncharacterized membrane protein YgcG